MGLYLVTGGAGFIGSNIVRELVRRGQKVRVIDNFVTGKKENLTGVLNKIGLITGDIRDKATLKKALKGVDVVLHQAALRSVERSVHDPGSTNDVNVGGTLKILIAARDAKVRRVVYASSSSVYGNTSVLPKVEAQAPQPISPYAVSKLTGEYYCQVFSHIYGLETVSLRYFNVFGPRQDPESEYAAVIPKFIKAILSHKSPTIHGDGMQSRDFTYIDNVVEANILAASRPDIGGCVFNIACGRRRTVLDIIKTVNKILDKEIKPVFVPPRLGDVRHTLADISNAEKVLGYTVKIGFEEGLKKTIEWYLSRGRK